MTIPSNDQPPILLQSRDHSVLLDVIDLLRSQGVSHYVPLPQLIVCGDQSSGKSSVLEAVSGVRFPTKDNLCTRFATELVLRRGSKANVAVSIVPGKERSDEEKATLLAFQVPEARIEAFSSLVDAAKDVMGLDKGVQQRCSLSGSDRAKPTSSDPRRSPWSHSCREQAAICR